MQGEPRSAAPDAALVRRFAAVVRRLKAEATSPAHDVRQFLLRVLGGEIGVVPPEPLPGAPAELALPAASVLGVLQYDAECLAILARFPPGEHEQILSVALRVIPRVPPATALAHRSWIMAMVDAVRGFGVRDRLGPFVRSLQTAGHFELVEAIRGSHAAEHIGAADRWLLDAQAACWAGAYDALRELLDQSPADGAGGDAELLAAIAHGVAGEAEAGLAALEAVRARGGGALRDV